MSKCLSGTKKCTPKFPKALLSGFKLNITNINLFWVIHFTITYDQSEDKCVHCEKFNLSSKPPCLLVARHHDAVGSSSDSNLLIAIIQWDQDRVRRKLTPTAPWPPSPTTTTSPQSLEKQKREGPSSALEPKVSRSLLLNLHRKPVLQAMCARKRWWHYQEVEFKRCIPHPAPNEQSTKSAISNQESTRSDPDTNTSLDSTHIYRQAVLLLILDAS